MQNHVDIRIKTQTWLKSNDMAKINQKRHVAAAAADDRIAPSSESRVNPVPDLELRWQNLTNTSAR